MCGEGTLDAQIITSLAPVGPVACVAECALAFCSARYFVCAVAQGAATTFWSIEEPSGTDLSSFLQTWIFAVASADPIPQVHSVSYGDDEANLSVLAMNAFNTEAAKLGLRGVSIIVSSGDGGAMGRSGQCAFAPMFPASSPYVTAVGATMGPESSQPEVACVANEASEVLITSGGGFSGQFPQPAFQHAAVAVWLQQATSAGSLPPSTMVPIATYSNFRGYPDVALLGHAFPLVIDGGYLWEDGTSASAPVFAAMVTQVNALRASEGLSALGYLNIALYQNVSSSAFNDIEVGENNCPEYDPTTNSWPTCCAYGYLASAGKLDFCWSVWRGTCACKRSPIRNE